MPCVIQAREGITFCCSLMLLADCRQHTTLRKIRGRLPQYLDNLSQANSYGARGLGCTMAERAQQAAQVNPDPHRACMRACHFKRSKIVYALV